MSQPNPLELAKQGNPQAIAALINKTLQPQGFKAQVARRERTLKIVVQGNTVPDQAKMVNFIAGGIKRLSISGLDELQLFGLQAGDEKPAWGQKVLLAAQEPTVLPAVSELTAQSGSKTQQESTEDQAQVPTETKGVSLQGCGSCLLLPLIFGLLVGGISYCNQRFSTPPQNASTIQQRTTTEIKLNRKLVSSSMFQGQWMLTVDEGELVCEPPTVIVFIAPDGQKYAVNGTAQGAGYPDIRPIWRDNPEIPSLKIDIGPLIEEGLQLCN